METAAAREEFDPRKEIAILAALCERLEEAHHNSFVAMARQQKNMLGLSVQLAMTLKVIDQMEPGIAGNIVEQATNETERLWPEIAERLGFDILPKTEGGK